MTTGQSSVHLFDPPYIYCLIIVHTDRLSNEFSNIKSESLVDKLYRT